MESLSIKWLKHLGYRLQQCIDTKTVKLKKSLVLCLSHLQKCYTPLQRISWDGMILQI